MNDATKKSARLSYFADGKYKKNPKAKRINANDIVFLYPIFFITNEAGYPKIRNEEKVAAKTRYDFADEISKVCSNNGIR